MLLLHLFPLGQVKNRFHAWNWQKYQVYTLKKIINSFWVSFTRGTIGILHYYLMNIINFVPMTFQKRIENEAEKKTLLTV